MTWEDIATDDKPTKEQRRALYRLGYSRWLVGQLSREQATKAIAEGIQRMGCLKGNAKG